MTTTPETGGDDFPQLLAYRIRDARQNMYEWTLQQLSEQMNGKLSASQLSRIETGKRDLSLSELSAIATALGLDVGRLMRPGRLCGASGQEIPEATR